MNYFTKEELEEISLKLIENPTRETLKELNDKYNKEEKQLDNATDNNVVIPSNEMVNVLPVEDKVSIPSIENQNMWELPITNNVVVPNEVSNQTLDQPQVSEIPTPVVEEPQINEVPSMEMPNIVNTSIPVVDSMPNAIEANNQVPSFEVPVTSMPVNNLEISTPETPQINMSNLSNYGSNTQNVVPSFEMPEVTVDTQINQIPNNEPIPFNGNLFEQNTPNINLMQTTDSFNTNSAAQMTNVDPLANINIPVGNEPFFNPSVEVANNNVEPTEIKQEGPSMFGQFEQNYM